MIRSLFVSVTPAVTWILWSSSLFLSFLPIAFPSTFLQSNQSMDQASPPDDRLDISAHENKVSSERGTSEEQILQRLRQRAEGNGLIGRVRKRIQESQQRSDARKKQTTNAGSSTKKPSSKNWTPATSKQVKPQQLSPVPIQSRPPSIAFPTPNRQANYLDRRLGQGKNTNIRPASGQNPGGFAFNQQQQGNVSSQIVKSEAIIGDQFNIGHIVFRLSPADYRRWLTRSIFVDDAQGRLMYPAVVPSFLDRLESKLNENLYKEPRDIHIWFVFGGREPIQVTIHASVDHQIVMTPEPVRRLRRRMQVQNWWRNFNQMLEEQAKSSDYPPLIQAYLGCLVQQRVGLAPPASNSGKKKASKMMQTWELLTASENLQVNYLKDMMCGVGQDPQPATHPLPNNIPWNAPNIPAVDPNVKIEPIAFVVPEECFYLRFGSWENQIWLKKLMNEHGGDLSRMVRLRGYKSLVGDLFRDQLAMESSSLDDLLGGRVIEDVAVVGFDTFFSEGAAAGLILQSKGKTLGTSLTAKRKAFAKKHQHLGVKLEHLKIDNVDATLLQSPDGRVRSYYVQLGSFHCITTSYALAVRFLETTKGIRSLGGSREFRYARAQMPLEREDTIFAYLSTKFLQNLLSPHYQIEMRRRLRSITEVQTLQMATWTAQSEGQQVPAGYANWESVPVDFRIAQLIARGYLPNGFNNRPDKSRIGLLEDKSAGWAKAKKPKRKRRKTRQKTADSKKKNAPAPLLNSFMNSFNQSNPKSKKPANSNQSLPNRSKSKSSDSKPDTLPLIGPGSWQKKKESKNGKTLTEKNSSSSDLSSRKSRQYFTSLQSETVDQQRRESGFQQQERGPLRKRLGKLIRKAIDEIDKQNQQQSGIDPLTGRPIPNQGFQPGQGRPQPLPLPQNRGQRIPIQTRPTTIAPGPLTIIDSENSLIQEVENRPVGKFLFGDTLRGVRGWMLPVADTAVTSVTAEEARWYQEMAAYFQQEWKQADPIMIAIKRYDLKDKVERVVFDGRIAPFGGDNLKWITDNIGKPMDVVPVKNPDDVIRFQASIRGGSIFPGTGAHQLLAAVQRDARQLHSVDPSEWWTTFKLIKDTPGYIASWPTAGVLDYLPMLGGSPDAEGFTHSIGRKVWRLQHNGFSVIAMDKNRLRKMKPFLNVQPAKNPAQVRLEVSDLANSQLADWANALWKQRSWQSSVANVRLLHLLMQYFHLPPDQAKQKAQSLLNARLVCSLGGEYQLAGRRQKSVEDVTFNNPRLDQLHQNGGFTSGMYWQSSHWPVRSRVAANQIPGQRSPLLEWFRGALLEVSHQQNRFVIHGYLDIQRQEKSSAKLPSFDLFKGFKF